MWRIIAINYCLIISLCARLNHSWFLHSAYSMPLCELLAQSHCFSRTGCQPCQCPPSLPHMLVSPILYTSLPACLSHPQAAIATSSLKSSGSQSPANVFLALILQEPLAFRIAFLSHVLLWQVFILSA